MRFNIFSYFILKIVLTCRVKSCYSRDKENVFDEIYNLMCSASRQNVAYKSQNHGLKPQKSHKREINKSLLIVSHHQEHKFRTSLSAIPHIKRK
jgi:hypothetical protein